MNRFAFSAILTASAWGLAGLSPAAIFNVSFNGTVNGNNTSFGNGTAISFTGIFDTADFIPPPPIPRVPLNNTVLQIGGVPQSGVSAEFIDFGTDTISLALQWNDPPPNPTFTATFSYPGASAAFPDTSGANLANLLGANIDQDGTLADPVLLSDFSVTLIPEPSAALLLWQGMLAMYFVIRRRRSGVVS